MTDRRKTPDRRSTTRTTPERRGLKALKVRVTRLGSGLLRVPAGTTGIAVPLKGGGNGACSVVWHLERAHPDAATHLFDGDFRGGLVEVPS